MSGPSVRRSPSANGNFDSVRNRSRAWMRLVLPLPLGPMTRLNGSSVRLVSRSALNFRNATEAITVKRSPRPRGKSTSVVARQGASADHAGNEAASMSARLRGDTTRRESERRHPYAASREGQTAAASPNRTTSRRQSVYLKAPTLSPLPRISRARERPSLD